MSNHYTLATVFVGALFLGVMWILRYIFKMFQMYHFFNDYVGYVHAHHAVNYRKARRLYQRLSTIRRSVNGEDLFDLALITYSRRLNDLDIYEKTKAMLNAIEPAFYKKTQFEYKYTEAEVQRYVFSLAGFSNKPDMIRFLLWIVVINPISVRRLNELL